MNTYKLFLFLFISIVVVFLSCSKNEPNDTVHERNGTDNNNQNDSTLLVLYDFVPYVGSQLIPSEDFYDYDLYNLLTDEFNSVPKWEFQKDFPDHNSQNIVSLVPIVEYSSNEIWAALVIHQVIPEGKYEFTIVPKLGYRSDNSYITAAYTSWDVYINDVYAYSDVIINYVTVLECSTKDDGFPWDDWGGQGGGGGGTTDPLHSTPPFDGGGIFPSTLTEILEIQLSNCILSNDEILYAASNILFDPNIKLICEIQSKEELLYNVLNEMNELNQCSPQDFYDKITNLNMYLDDEYYVLNEQNPGQGLPHIDSEHELCPEFLHVTVSDQNDAFVTAGIDGLRVKFYLYGTTDYFVMSFDKMFLEMEPQQPCNLSSADVFVGAINLSVDAVQNLIIDNQYDSENDHDFKSEMILSINGYLRDLAEPCAPANTQDYSDMDLTNYSSPYSDCHGTVFKSFNHQNYTACL